MSFLIDGKWVDALRDTIREWLSGKQDALTPDESVTLAGGEIGVKTPVRQILSQEAFDALPEEERKKGLYVISDAESASGEGTSALFLVSIDISLLDGTGSSDRTHAEITDAMGQGKIVIARITVQEDTRIRLYSFPSSFNQAENDLYFRAACGEMELEGTRGLTSLSVKIYDTDEVSFRMDTVEATA